MEEPKVAKLNIKDHFEEVYLRSKTIKKYLPLADVSILKNPEFGRVVNYMSGYYFKGRGDVAHLWNTTKTQDLDPLQSGRAEKIFVSNGKTFTAGYYNNGKDMVAAYWKDGIRTTLSSNRSEAYGITTDLAFVCE